MQYFQFHSFVHFPTRMTNGSGSYRELNVVYGRIAGVPLKPKTLLAMNKRY